MTDFMKKTCAICPFSRSKTLVLHPERAEEFASMACNPFNDFPCHKTAGYAEDDRTGEGGFVHGATSKTCHGFLTLQASETGRAPEGFKPDGDGFDDWHEIVDTHEELWDQQQRERKHG